MSETSDQRILFYLKRVGPQRASDLGVRLGMTSVGARQHLAKLRDEGLVIAEPQPQPRGRPFLLWRLTPKGHARFPDRHADLTLELIRAARSAFGEAGVEALISERETAARARYVAAASRCKSLRGKVEALARLRADEGYMASAEHAGAGEYLLIEDHCPICAAAEICQGFCRSELALFQAALGDDISIERTDHLLAGARRCAYRIRHRA